MNERITDLHNQAIIFSGKNGGLRISSHIPNDYIEKFAELIVLECASIVENQGRFLPYLVLCKEVKKKFGIRE